ncbi:MAG: ABC transporter ATP-binding protein [Candidatus Aminicenantes bacterium]|nr:ABC transporter ATP-binding protein [Candidatus Aminicenantes bacterium]MDH5715889.1 ABC transporter ATP-binding protein [Candidatus Aminicenantes bacterium]
MSPEVLQVNNLKTYFYLSQGVVRAVDGVSFSVREGESLGLVGESGCGKTLTALSIMRLVPPPGKLIAGEVSFLGRDLVSLSEKEMQRVRGKEIGMVFQEPMTSLNPVYTVGEQISEVISFHQGRGRREAQKAAVSWLRLVGISDPDKMVSFYPHQLSGGMRQRVMIAIALCCYPRLLIADEPTTALDVTIQAQIINLLGELRKELGIALLLITHDLAVVAEVADRVVVMYAGRVVEEASVSSLFNSPGHPYTRGLIDSVPRFSPSRGMKGKKKLKGIEGMVPDLLHLPSGCSFHPRCPQRVALCEREIPSLFQVNKEQRVSCFLYGSQSVSAGEPTGAYD